MVESLASANENCLNLDVDHFLFLVHYQVSHLQWEGRVQYRGGSVEKKAQREVN